MIRWYNILVNFILTSAKPNLYTTIPYHRSEFLCSSRCCSCSRCFSSLLHPNSFTVWTAIVISPKSFLDHCRSGQSKLKCGLLFSSAAIFHDILQVMPASVVKAILHYWRKFGRERSVLARNNSERGMVYEDMAKYVNSVHKTKWVVKLPLFFELINIHSLVKTLSCTFWLFLRLPI